MAHIRSVRQSARVFLNNSMHTAKISATAPTLTALSSAFNRADFRILGMYGFKSNTNRNEGKNMPMVAANAPASPFICHPINVAVDRTGPGVICPTATASSNCCWVSQPLATSSVSRKAKST